MSGTNAIHGIVVLGAGGFGEMEHPSLVLQVILFVAVVFGGTPPRRIRHRPNARHVRYP